jgi:hypothetical protein
MEREWPQYASDSYHRRHRSVADGGGSSRGHSASGSRTQSITSAIPGVNAVRKIPALVIAAVLVLAGASWLVVI